MKAIRIIFSALFILICCIPVFTMPFFADNSTSEKRQEAVAPSITLEDGGFNWEYPSQLDSFLSDHFSFRTPAVTLASLLKAELGTSNQDKIIVGKEDWLFFGETLDDYMGEDLLSDYDIKRLATTLSLINEYVESCGGKFVFAAAPNKNSIYGEFMPYYYTDSASSSNLERLNKLLENENYCLDLLTLLKNSKDKGLLYHKRDSHWNNLGASIAFDAICKRLGVTVSNYSEIGYSIQKNWRGDLDDMIFPALDIMDDNVIFDKEYSFEYGPKYKTPEDLLISTTNKQKQGSLVVFRDSFYNSLLPFFAEEFGNAEFTRVLPYRITATVNDGDLVIIEIAERNLKNLLSSAPIMTAVAKDEASFEIYDKANVISTKLEKSGKYYHLCGDLADDVDATKLVVEVTFEGVTKYYKPFPIYESELLGDGENGFSLYLDEFIEESSISFYTTK